MRIEESETSEVEDLRETDTHVVFAVDQQPFSVPGQGTTNIFGLLYPLMTENGKLLRSTDRNFPRRGRVWWMLRPDTDPQEVVPGMVWSGPLERTRDHGGDDFKKDWYQISKRLATPGTRHYLDVLDLPVDEPVLGDLLSFGLKWKRPVQGRVLLRGLQWVMGPLRAQFDAQQGRLTFQPLNPGEPWVFRWRRELLDKPPRAVQEFSFTANQHNHNPNIPRTEVKLAFLHERHLETLREQGQKVDGATDQQVINWVLRKLKLTRREQQNLGELLARSNEVRAAIAEEEFAGRLERFRKIIGDSERVANLGAEIAAEVGKQEAFTQLLNQHKDVLVKERVEDEIRRRSQEIQTATAAEQERKERVRAQIAELEQTFDKQSRENEEKFRKDNEGRQRELERRESDVEAREKELAEREREVEARLERVVGAYRKEAEQITDQFVAQLPLLKRAGLLGGPAAAEPDRSERPSTLPMPAFLSTPRARGDMDEEKFIKQFEHVVERRGFAFEFEDLVNFHACVKTGLWTVLAGASGLGKSSLSRLYAEALGASEEHLLVPVRPDWLDDRDVIGAFNALSGRYEPAPSGLVDHLIAAREDQRTGRGGIYLICLDEMNLARVEHYFAAFLSLLEQPPEKREIRLFAPGLERPGDPYGPHRVLPLGDNLRFIGTVNIDETTHFFSPKVLDRAPIVSLARPSLKQGLSGQPRPSTLSGIVPIHLEEYRAWIQKPAVASAGVLELVIKIDEALRESRWGVGFRVRDRILSYVASTRHLLNEEMALDQAIFGNIAPRLRPNAPGAEKVLRALRDLLPSGRFPRTAAVLEAMERAEGERDFFQLV
jgi:hypothetical protein